MPLQLHSLLQVVRLEPNRIKIRKLNLSNTKLALIAVPVGAVLGVVAGLVGIGGGISPLLMLSGLADPKRAAATAQLLYSNELHYWFASTFNK